jgi:hypothetical protein
MRSYLKNKLKTKGLGAWLKCREHHSKVKALYSIPSPKSKQDQDKERQREIDTKKR